MIWYLLIFLALGAVIAGLFFFSYKKWKQMRNLDENEEF
jgi:formate/nitrite transporter FocA (FNT family)